MNNKELTGEDIYYEYSYLIPEIVELRHFLDENNIEWVDGSRYGQTEGNLKIYHIITVWCVGSLASGCQLSIGVDEHTEKNTGVRVRGYAITPIVYFHRAQQNPDGVMMPVDHIILQIQHDMAVQNIQQRS